MNNYRAIRSEADYEAALARIDELMELAQRLGIHPAIIAGRVRYETRNFRLLSHFVGTGTLHKQFLKGEEQYISRPTPTCPDK